MALLIQHVIPADVRQILPDEARQAVQQVIGGANIKRQVMQRPEGAAQVLVLGTSDERETRDTPR